MISDSTIKRSRRIDMTQNAAQAIDALAAPRDDDGVLIWPTASTLLETARKNRTLRKGYTFELSGRPANSWFRHLDDAPLTFITGHQPEFLHPGVWAKNVAVSRLSNVAGGLAAFLVVDSDAPHRLAIDWPDDSEGLCHIGSAALRSFRTGPSFEHLDDRIAGDMGIAMGGAPDEISVGGVNLMSVFREAFLDSTGGTANRADAADRPDYVACWIRAMRAMERALGCQSPDYQRVSDWFDWRTTAPAFAQTRESSAAFVAHLITHAREFANAYNAALAGYRLRRNMHGRQHPVPDLAVEPVRVELPFWHVGTAAPRHRLWVSFPGGDRIGLHAENEPLGEVSASMLDREPLATLSGVIPPRGLRPRALAQTLFARLFECDLFVHGIGGAKYDTITDEIIRKFFGVQPPDFACITATLRLPVRRFGVTPENLAAARHAERDVRFNPLRHANGGSLPKEAKEWIDLREQAVAESTQLHRAKSRERTRRRTAFQNIRRANDSLLRLLPNLKDDALHRARELERQAESDRIAASREWFVALHPRESLLRLIGKLGDALDGQK